MSHTKEATQAVKPTSTMFKGPVYLVAKEMFAMSRVSVRQQGSSVPSQCRRREDDQTREHHERTDAWDTPTTCKASPTALPGWEKQLGGTLCDPKIDAPDSQAEN